MDIETRLETLEKKLLYHKRLWMSAACLLAVAIVIGATRPVPKEIVAERFIIKDAAGKLRSAWGAGKNGEVILGMTDGKKPRVVIAYRKNGAGMFVSDSEGKIRLNVGILKGIPSITLFDKNGKIQVFINAKDREGTPSIAVVDSSERVRASMGLDEGKSPGFYLRDANGKARGIYGLTEDGEPKLVFLNKRGDINWLAPPGPK